MFEDELKKLKKKELGKKVIKSINFKNLSVEARQKVVKEGIEFMKKKRNHLFEKAQNQKKASSKPFDPTRMTTDKSKRRTP